MSDSVRPHRRQPTRLPRPWDPPGKNTGVGCHFLLQCMKVKSESEVAQSCLTLRNPVDCSLPGSSTHGIFQARVLEWGAISFSRKPHIAISVLITSRTQKNKNRATKVPQSPRTASRKMSRVRPQERTPQPTARGAETGLRATSTPPLPPC